MLHTTRTAQQKLNMIRKHLKRSPRLAFAGDRDERKMSKMDVAVLLQQAIAALDAGDSAGARAAVLEAIDALEKLARLDAKNRRRVLGHN
jgi:hypothetical protein